MNLMGLFGSSARQAVKPGESFEGRVGTTPGMNAALANGVRDRMGEIGTLQRPPVNDGNPERSYLGGLVRYQRPEGQTKAERMQLIGAMMSDVGSGLRGGNGGNLSKVQEAYRARSERDRVRGMIQKLYPGDSDAELMLDIDPDAIAKAWVEKQKPDKPVYVEGPDGIYEPGPPGGPKWVKAQGFERPTPSGWEHDQEGGLRPQRNGPYDPDYIARTAGLRRDAVVSRPMPSRARSGGGGAPKGVAPWKNRWTP